MPRNRTRWGTFSALNFCLDNPHLTAQKNTQLLQGYFGLLFDAFAFKLLGIRCIGALKQLTKTETDCCSETANITTQTASQSRLSGKASSPTLHLLYLWDTMTCEVKRHEKKMSFRPFLTMFTFRLSNISQLYVPQTTLWQLLDQEIVRYQACKEICR